ncbi:MAG: tetratricopeptide repeat protein, partial [Rubricoccaceae bacterium]|nr:tetratricopeptide repeat protein [Rubricoccaceae bacterium]
MALETLDTDIEGLEHLMGTDRVDAVLDHVDAMRTRDPERQLELLAYAHELATELGYEKGIAVTRGIRGRTLYVLSRHHEAVGDIQYAINYFDSEGERDLAAMNRGMLAALYSSQGNYEQAISLAMENLDAAREAGDNDGVGWVLHGLSGAYLELGQPEEALRLGMEALEIFVEIGQVTGQARAHSAIGTVLRTMDRFDEARGHHEISLQLFQQGKDRLGESRAHHDLGLIAFEKGEFEQALAFHEKALSIRREVNNRQSVCTSLIEIGRTLNKLGRCEDALEVLNEPCEIAEDLELRPKLFAAHLALAEACQMKGDAAQALVHYRRYHEIHEEVLGAQATGRIRSIQAQYEAERAQQEAEIERLRNVELREKNEQLENLLAELKRTQDRLVQSEKLASLGRVTSGIAHEIKNPLNFVINFAELNSDLMADLQTVLEERRTDLPRDLVAVFTGDFETIAENTQRVSENARRADGIVKSMLGHVRHGGGSHTPTDLHALLVQSVADTFGSSVEKDGIEVGWELDSEIEQIDMTPQSMKRVFINVLDNAAYSVRA